MMYIHASDSEAENLVTMNVRCVRKGR